LLCRSSNRFRQLALLIFILCVGFGFFRNIYSTSALGQRLTSSEMTSDGRFATWQSVLERSWDHPFLGDGFRVFGDRFYMKDPITGQVEVSKDSAHGFFMDVAADHGLVLGLTLLGLWMLAWVRSLFLATRVKSDQWRLCLIAFLAWPIALLFSGSFWGAFYMAVPLALVVSLERDNLLFQPSPDAEPESPALLSGAFSARAGSVAGD
jgi:O-antigen ligase